MQLKTYQELALQSLETFCKHYSETGFISESFQEARRKFELPEIPYAHYTGLEVPSLCFRIPTGGGKTLLGAYSIPLITKKLLNVDSSLVFWLAPTDAIVQQTLNILKNQKHPYREYLDQQFSGKTVNIMTVEEAHSKAFDLSSEVPIIIATIQTFSVEKPEGRKFYQENGVYQSFFDNLLETPSLYAAIKKSNPIIIMDEAHNAKTDLRVSKLIDLNPSFMLELTATPQTVHREAEGLYASNILYSVSASQLKAEDMIKLPIVLETINKWEYAIAEAIKKRKELEDLAKLEYIESAQYIRPMVLFKAESNRGNTAITHDKILDTLIKDHGIPREEIAVHTGNFNDLDNVDLMSQNCSIRYVITVDKIKEGWDAPFASVLATVGNMSSSVAVEQLLGRVLRNPYAKKKSKKDLEKAYAFVASKETVEVIKNLKDSLIDNGFEEMEAEIHISISPNSNKAADNVLGGLFNKTTKLESFDIEEIPEKFKEHINYNQATKEFSILTPISQKDSEEFKETVKKAISIPEEIEKIEEILEVETATTMNNFRDIFKIPKLMANTSKGLFEFEKSILLDEIEWTDQEIASNAKLSEVEFSIKVQKDLTEIDISESEKIQVRKLDSIKENLFSLTGEPIKLNDRDIVKLLLRHIDSSRIQTITPKKLARFIHLIVLDLMNNRGYSTIELKANLYLLVEAIFNKIKTLENKVIKKQYTSLFKEDSYFTVSPERVFTFDPDNYPASLPLKAHSFKKHYYKLIDKMNEAEYKFADYLDNLEEVEFWIRNLERNPKYAFWLQTSTDKFYPDFVVKLKSGKILVLEYKGSHLDGSDSQEKEMLGLAWAGLDDNLGFALVYKNDYKEKVSKLLS